MKTTVAIDKEVSKRVMEHAEELGNRSMSAMVDFMLTKSCDFIDTHGYDSFIKIPPGKKNEVVQTSEQCR